MSIFEALSRATQCVSPSVRHGFGLNNRFIHCFAPFPPYWSDSSANLRCLDDLNRDGRFKTTHDSTVRDGVWTT